MIKIFLLALILGFLLDKIFGDPHGMPHPVCLIGNIISKLEKSLYKITDKSVNREKILFIQGVKLAVVTVFLTGLIASAVSFIVLMVDVKMGFISKGYYILTTAIFTFMAYQILAMKSLKDESMKVYKTLNYRKEEMGLSNFQDELIKKEQVKKGRKAVSMIVGRDTENLTYEEIVKATVETVAENTSDGVIAPMMYFAIGGPVLAFMYKAVNTLDSMVGYKNQKYLYFGRFSAKLDDVLNFIPARLTGILMIIASGLLGYNMKNGWKIFKRDRFNHSSPNSGQSESVCAGALEIQLAGNSSYFGKIYEKDFIGDKIREIEAEDIKRAIRLMECTCYINLFIVILAFLFFNLGM